MVLKTTLCGSPHTPCVAERQRELTRAFTDFNPNEYKTFINNFPFMTDNCVSKEWTLTITLYTIVNCWVTIL